MKKVLLFAAGILIASTQSFAQNAQTLSNSQFISIGPVIGFGDSWVGHMSNSSAYFGNVSSKTMFMPSGYIGVGLIYARNEHWGWGGQLTLGTEGYKEQYTYNPEFGRPYTETYTATPLYLRVPLRAYYFFGDYRNTVRPKVYLGPSFGLKLSESDNVSGGTESNVAATTGTFRTFDFGINAGAGVNIKLAKTIWLNMDLGYTQGLVDVLKDPENNYNVNHNLDFNAGVLFGIK
jgi:hypothetical protein